ncbi:MAG: hypothetical protein FJY75_05005, partial [Candidatus Eisenbacteria bacterium]|nr:hypothetical protein [Candidatus Eisenbacteria bacterium]
MGTAHFLQLERKDYDSGRWFARLRDEWAAGRVGLVEIAPEPSGDPELRAAIETMLASNGSYEPGDRAVIHARPAALDMAGETALLLRARGVEARIILGMASLGRQVRELVEIARRSVEGAPAGDATGAAREATAHAPAGDAAGALSGAATGGPAEAAAGAAAPPRDYSRADAAALDGIQACYRSLLEPIEREGRGHWIVPIGTAPDPEPDCVPALDFFSKAAGRGLAPLGALRVDGRIRSHDIWLYPGELDVRRLNEGLPAERHWTLDEWRALVFRSMAVGADELRRIALGTEAIALTIAASERGGRLHYARED